MTVQQLLLICRRTLGRYFLTAFSISSFCWLLLLLLLLLL